MNKVYNNKKVIFVLFSMLVITFVIFYFQVKIFGLSSEVEYIIQNDWGNGAVVNVEIKNLTSEDIEEWNLRWSFKENQEIISMWNATFSQNGNIVTVENLEWSKTILSGDSINFGFNLTYSESNSIPDSFYFNGEELDINNDESGIEITAETDFKTASPTTESTDNSTNKESSYEKVEDETLEDIPDEYIESIEWVYKNRMLVEDSVSRQNLNFDQAIDGEGSINYVVRWQSSKEVTLKQRQDIKDMIYRQINNWNDKLANYDGWPYEELDVNVVGWACTDSSQLLDLQDDEVVYTDYTIDSLSESDSSIPEKLPYAPDELSRFVNYVNDSYEYPGGLDKRFDMYLWATANFSGGAGGDWGQRISDNCVLESINMDESQIIEHEIGHNYGLPDFYQEDERPPSGFPENTIMWAGNSSTVTNWDKWMVRYTWTQLKDDETRFSID